MGSVLPIPPDLLVLLGIVLAGYALGSVPFSFLVARSFGIVDVRRVGSGNVGATNVMRAAGPLAGILALLLDASKGGLAAWLAGRLGPVEWGGPAGGLAAVVGHLFPVWLSFRGGKGAATGVGVFAWLAPHAALAALAVFAATVAATRYVSLGSILGAIAVPVACLVGRQSVPVTAVAVVVAALVVQRHHDNIARLRLGGEPRLGAPGP